MSPKIFVDTQLYIEAYPLKDHVWFNFLKNASQSEFLKSQEGFFYAVKAFPRMLSKLASMIEDSESRLLVIENLWEEHGQGNSTLFHTNTYFQYLVSLGLKGDINSISHNPWVEEWIDNVLDKEMSASQYASYLAGIEYIYARISKKITQKLKKFDLVCEQTHYQNHSVLDYAHAGELLEVAIKCQKNIDEDLMEAFKLGVAEFLYLFKDMVLLTEFEASEIAKDKIAFYYAREDAQIECNVVKKIAKDEVKVLMICSGGENSIELLKLDKIVDITALDINPNQIALAKAKIKSINKNHELSDELFISHEGKFEKIFEILANSFNTSELLGIANKEHNALEKLKHVCENIFSNKILEIVFTPEATR